MFNQLYNGFSLWAFQLKNYIHSEVIQLQPHEYCVMATFTISIGFVLLSGRR